MTVHVSSRNGLVDPGEVHASRTLAVHLDDYAEVLESKGDSPDHVRSTRASIAAVLRGCELSELVVDEREQARGGAGVAPFDIGQDAGHLAHTNRYAPGRTSPAGNPDQSGFREGFLRRGTGLEPPVTEPIED